MGIKQKYWLEDKIVGKEKEGLLGVRSHSAMKLGLANSNKSKFVRRHTRKQNGPHNENSEVWGKSWDT